MLKPGWLRRGLIDAQREAAARPELRERVRAYPSGFICEARDESLPHAKNPKDEFWQGVLRTTREMESWPGWKLTQAAEGLGSLAASRILGRRARYARPCSSRGEVCS